MRRGRHSLPHIWILLPSCVYIDMSEAADRDLHPHFQSLAWVPPNSLLTIHHSLVVTLVTGALLKPIGLCFGDE